MTAILRDERLAELFDEGQNSSRAWELELRLRGMDSMTRTVERVLAANKVIDHYAVPCPQQAMGICAGEGKHERIFECPIANCDFIGCVACYDRHALTHARALSQPDGFGEDEDQGDVSDHLVKTFERQICADCIDNQHCRGSRQGCYCDCGLETAA